MKAAAYCRVSTDREEQQSSLEAQKRYFAEYISSRGDLELYGIYADEGITGTVAAIRPAFFSMLEDARRGKFQLILTKEVSRFSRNILDTIALTRELRSLGVEVIFTTDGIRTMDPDAELRLSIMASIAQEESRKTSARVKWGQSRRMEKGVVFGHSLLGYSVENGKMTIVPKEALLVKEAFRLYAGENSSLSKAAAELTRKASAMGLPHLVFSPSTLGRMLKNEKYMGDLVQKKTCTPDYLTHLRVPNRGREEMIVLHDHHEPIVSPALFHRVQQLLRQRGPQSGDRSCARQEYPLSGKVFCGECGSVFIARRRKRKDGSICLRWGCACAARKGRAGCAIGRLVPDQTLHSMVRQCIGRFYPCKEQLYGKVCRYLPRSNAALSPLLHARLAGLIGGLEDSAFLAELIRRITIHKSGQALVGISGLAQPLVFSLPSRADKTPEMCIPEASVPTSVKSPFSSL